jgi:hypothetical protein
MTDLSPEDRSFVELARLAPGPTAADRARVRRAIAAAAPLAGLGTLAGSSKAAGAFGGVVKSALIFVTAVGVGSGVVIGVAELRAPSATPPTRVAAPQARPVAPVVIAQPSEPPEPVAEPAPAAPEPARAPAPRPSRPRAPVEPTPAIAPSPVRAAQTRCTLENEANVLQTAQRLLGTSARESLETLDALERECPGGELIEERHAARALALCALGRRDEGRRHLEWLRANEPTSPALLRVRRACEEP